MSKLTINILKLFIHCGALLPVCWLYYQASLDQLGGDPVKEVIHFTGIGALNLLLASLTVSPLSKWLKQGKLIQIRRLIGLYALFYAVLHVLSFWLFELQFDLNRFVSELIKRPYITIGMLAFCIIFALGMTSLDRFKRAMGAKWQRLHNLSYLLVLLAIVHFWWSVKSDISEPFLYLLIALFLLSSRKDKFKRWFKNIQ